MISLFDLLFIGAICLVILYLYLGRNRNYWKNREVPYEKPSVIFGSLTDAFLGKIPMGRIFHILYKKFPEHKVVGWFKFQSPGLIIRDPELARKILILDFHYFRNNDFELDEKTDPILGRNLFVLRDELWKKNRALITPAFTSGKIKAVYTQMIGVAEDLVKYLKDHPEELHVKHTMSRYTSEVVARCALGIEGNNFKDPNPKMHEMGKLIFEPTTVKNLKMISFFLMPGVTKLFRLKMVPDHVIQFFDDILRDVIVYRQEHNIEKNDLVQYLIDVKKKSLEVANGTIQSEIVTKTYTDEDILAGCITFFVEGYETSSLVLNNVLYQLALHPDVQETLRCEIEETLKEGEITFEKLHGMNYLHSVFLETQRILPALYQMQKVCMEKYEMDIGASKPLIIEKGTSVAIPVYSIHNDPLYWEEPHLFRPERFMNKEEAQVKAKGIYMPFGDGPRMCPGSRMATTIVKLAVVHIVKELDILPTGKTPQKINPDPKYFMVAHKGGIYLRFAEKAR